MAVAEPIIEHHHHTTDNSALNLMIGFLILAVVLLLFFYYGLPLLRSATTPAQVNVPDKIDVNVNGGQ